MSRASLPNDLRGASRLAIDLTVLVTDLVETMHHNIARRPGMLGRPVLAPTRGITGLVYRSVRGVTRLVGAGIDAALAPLASLVTAEADWPGREPVIAALNGVLGDTLESSGNPLAIAMELRVAGKAVEIGPAALASAFPGARGRVLVMVHGLCMSDVQWTREAHDHGQALAGDLDADLLYLRYNSGRHISVNGADLDARLERLLEHWPVPLRELVLVGHSMGGLVIRSACATAEARGSRWIGSLRAMIFLGAPHHGAPLERAGHGVDLLLAASPYTIAFTRLGRLRSAGITDLRHGNLQDCDWQRSGALASAADARQPVPLPPGVACFAIAGSLGKRPSTSARAPRGDGLVPVASALGRHPRMRMTLDIPPAHQDIAYGTGHLALLSSAAVCDRMRRWLADEAPRWGGPTVQRVSLRYAE